MAYVLGFLCADGAVYKNPRGGCYIAFYSVDREIIQEIRWALGSNHKIGVRNKAKGGRPWKVSYVLQIGSKKVFSDLKEFGIVPNKSLVIPFPRVPQQFLGHFVRGYFDGDGGVYFRKYWVKARQKLKWISQVRFVSGSEKFLKGLWQALTPCVHGGYLYKKPRGGYDLAFSHRDGRALFHLMYDDVPGRLFLERKYRTFMRVMRLLKPAQA